jgi:hypothetical protein
MALSGQIGRLSELMQEGNEEAIARGVRNFGEPAVDSLRPQTRHCPRRLLSDRLPHPPGALLKSLLTANKMTRPLLFC